MLGGKNTTNYSLYTSYVYIAGFFTGKKNPNPYNSSYGTNPHLTQKKPLPALPLK